MNKQIFFLIPLFLFLTFNLSAQLAAWNFNALDNTALAPTTGSGNLTESNISFGTSVTNLGNQGSGNGCGQSYISDGYTTNPSPDLNGYWAFTLTPVGATMDIATIELVVQSDNSGPDQFIIRYSLDSYTSDLGSGVVTNTCVTLSVPISMAPTGAPVTFRIYFFNANTSNGDLRIDNLSASGILLPITLTSFSAKPTATTAILNFSTATERNNDYFSIERSKDGATFTEIGRVAGNGTTFEKQDYIYTDASPSKGINYYRLKQVDFDGAFTYSGVVSVTIGRGGTFVVSPSPAADQLKVRFEEATTEAGRYEMYDHIGRLVQTGEVAAESIELNLAVNTLTAGTYILRMTNGRETVAEQFYKQ
jgi:Secretion system C-terminal sorting domain